jgi:hypothetical protein
LVPSSIEGQGRDWTLESSLDDIKFQGRVSNCEVY